MGITEHVDNVSMMDVYSSIKYIKSAFKIQVKSYLIKKILMTDEMKGKLLANGSKKWKESIFEVLQHSELRDKFEENEQYRMWRDNLKENVNVKKTHCKNCS